MQNNIIDLLGFKDRDICAKITKTSPSSVEVMVSKTCKPKYCPVCSHRMYSRGPYTRTLNHPILQDGRKVTILLKQRRWKCTNSVCGHFETEQFSFVERYKHNTNMTDFMIVEDFRTPTLSAAEIARRRNVSDTYAIYTFARYVDMDRLPLTEAISVDEVHLKISRYCNYALVIQDFITGDPIDLVADRKKQTTEPYFHSIPLKERAKVKYLITDMYRPFEKYVSSYFPNAIHIVDSFHVIQLIIRHILGYIRRRQRDIDERDRARHERIEQDIHRRFEFHHSRDYYIVKKYHWLITKNNSDIEYKQKPYYDARMGRYMTTQDYEEALFKIDPVFRKLRDLKEIYIRFNNRYVGKPKEAAAGLRAVIQHYRNSDQKIFYKYIADTLEEYFDEIANSFIVVEKYSKNGKYAARLSNGPMESLNRIPKDLKRNARGYRNFEHIRQRFLFSQRSSAAVRANPKPLEEVLLKSNIKRGPYVKKAYRADCIDKSF